MKSKERILVVGAGFVGLATATFLAERMGAVAVAEKNQFTVESLGRGKLHFHEPELGRRFARAMSSGRLSVSLPNKELYRQATIIIIAIDSVDVSNWKMRLETFRRMVRWIGDEKRRAKTTVVLKSTNILGFADYFRGLLDDTAYGKSVGLAVNPEFLREGYAYEDTARPFRIVVGSDDPAVRKRLSSFYKSVYGSRIPMVSPDARSAELIKLASNLYLSHRLAFVHEIASYARRTGLDAAPILNGLSLDSRIGGDYFKPGLGFGGSCLPKDCNLINAQELGNKFHFLTAETALAINERVLDEIIDLLKSRLGSLRGRKIAILGAAFKAETDDTRGSRAVMLARKLRRRGVRISIYEPYLEKADSIVDARLPLESSISDCLRAAHAIVIGTPHRSFRSLKPAVAASLVKRKLVCDPFALLVRSSWEKHGFRFI